MGETHDGRFFLLSWCKYKWSFHALILNQNNGMPSSFVLFILTLSWAAQYKPLNKQTNKQTRRLMYLYQCNQSFQMLNVNRSSKTWHDLENISSVV